MAYAARTRVPISRTKTDIEELLTRHGAPGFASALSWQTSVQSLPYNQSLSTFQRERIIIGDRFSRVDRCIALRCCW